MKLVRRLFVLSMALALAACQAAPPKPAADSSELVVGVAGPMTGDLASFGAQLQHGAERAVNDINASGGVLGKKLRLVVGDDGCKPERAAARCLSSVTSVPAFRSRHRRCITMLACCR
jgi:branched-chain amino acid transport system substrate-binding protein